MSRIVVDTVDKDGSELKLAVLIPGHKILQEAMMVYNVKLTSFIRSSIEDGSKLFSREQLERHLDDLGIWTDKDARQFLQLQLELRSSELKLRQGGIKKSEAQTISLQMKAKRVMLLSLYNRRSQFDSITMESMAENHKFKFLITRCAVTDKDDTPFFTSIESYEKRQNEQAAVDVATALAGHIYGYDKNTEADLIENKCLKEFGLADDQGRLINKDGLLVDMSGNLINEDGRFVDKQGKFVDNQGRLIDKNGDFIIKETKPFIDDTEKPETKHKKTKRTAKK